MAEWKPIETAPNDVFDVLAKYWDAGLDRFFQRRFIDCVRVGDDIHAGLLTTIGQEPQHIRLLSIGYKPTHWMPIPELPVDTPSK